MVGPFHGSRPWVGSTWGVRSRRQDAVPLGDAVRLGGQYGVGIALDRDLADVVALLDLVDRLQALDHLAEHGVLAVQPGGGDVGDEELAAVGVRAGVGHRQHAALVADAVVGLVLEAVAGAAAAGAPGGIGRASGRERVGKYVEISVGAG